MDMRAGLQSCISAIGAIASRIFQVALLSTIGKSNSSAGVLRLLILRLNLPEKQTASKWAPDQETHFFQLPERNEFAFEVATGDGVVGLECIEANEVLELGDVRALAIFHACQLETPM